MALLSSLRKLLSGSADAKSSGAADGMGASKPSAQGSAGRSSQPANLPADPLAGRPASRSASPSSRAGVPSASAQTSQSPNRRARGPLAAGGPGVDRARRPCRAGRIARARGLVRMAAVQLPPARAVAAQGRPALRRRAGPDAAPAGAARLAVGGSAAAPAGGAAAADATGPPR
ncbi:hypothetical protein Ddc_20250 [Ditylenchus destructor]|nr:hypothetical protein Ddc_20250 [Ditylenchus destructor]